MSNRVRKTTTHIRPARRTYIFIVKFIKEVVVHVCPHFGELSEHGDLCEWCMCVSLNAIRYQDTRAQPSCPTCWCRFHRNNFHPFRSCVARSSASRCIHSFALFFFSRSLVLLVYVADAALDRFDSLKYKQSYQVELFFKWKFSIFAPTKRANEEKKIILKLRLNLYVLQGVCVCEQASVCVHGDVGVCVCVCILNESRHLINSASQRFLIQFYSFLWIDKKPGETIKRKQKHTRTARTQLKTVNNKIGKE